MTTIAESVKEHLGPFPNRLVYACAIGEVDIRAIAIREVKNRGLGIDGRWAGFDHAAMQWDKHEQDHREVTQELLDIVKGVRARIAVGRGLSSAEANRIDAVIARAGCLR